MDSWWEVGKRRFSAWLHKKEWEGDGLLSPWLTVGVSLAAASGGLRIPLGLSSTYSQLTSVSAICGMKEMKPSGPPR